jgi:catechol 2,3-dioxygenase-like lactoylglutathione lyase family enzyme
MLDHVSITVSDITAAEPFYDAIMKALGVVKVGRREDWLGYGERTRAANPERVYIAIRKGSRPDDAAGRHWCFKAKSRTQVDAFWDAEIAAGGSDEGPPGLRNYHASYYAAFLRDPTATGSKPFAITPQTEIHQKALPVIPVTEEVRAMSGCMRRGMRPKPCR